MFKKIRKIKKRIKKAEKNPHKRLAVCSSATIGKRESRQQTFPIPNAINDEDCFNISNCFLINIFVNKFQHRHRRGLVRPLEPHEPLRPLSAKAHPDTSILPSPTRLQTNKQIINTALQARSS
jgi:hypothetical protein